MEPRGNRTPREMCRPFRHAIAIGSRTFRDLIAGLGDNMQVQESKAA